MLHLNLAIFLVHILLYIELVLRVNLLFLDSVYIKLIIVQNLATLLLNTWSDFCAEFSSDVIL